MVHRREIEGDEVVLGNQGALYEGAMTWWDHDTGSIWSQPRGRAIAGPREGTALELLPVQVAPWDQWREAHPDTVALDFGPLREAGVANATVAGAEVAVVIDGDRWTVFSRKLPDRVLTFDRRGDRLVDTETSSVWDPVSGRARDGPLGGTQLGVLPSFTSFEHDFVRLWPDGRFWPE